MMREACEPNQSPATKATAPGSTFARRARHLTVTFDFSVCALIRYDVSFEATTPRQSKPGHRKPRRPERAALAPWMHLRRWLQQSLTSQGSLGPSGARWAVARQ